jgi:hypothetical protein
MYLATMPLAAQKKEILLFDTTRSAISLIVLAQTPLLSPVMEKKGILGNTTGRRPGDVMFPHWTEGKALVVDVAVTSPLTATYERLEDPCEWYAATPKHGKYDADFTGT